MLLFATLFAGLLAGDTIALPWPPVQPVRPAAVVVQRQPATPLVTLRLSVVANDPPGFAGAGHLIQHLVEPALRERVGRVGGRVQVQRTADALVYAVTGPAAELEHLAASLISVLRPVSPSMGDFLRAQHQLREERLAEWETAQQHVRAALRLRLFADDVSAAGTEAAAARLGPEILGSVWARMYRPERVSVVAVGDVETAAVERAFSGLPRPLAAAPLPELRDTVVAASPGAAESTRGWYGLGYPASELEPAALTVAAQIVGERLRRRLPGAQVEAEHWWTHHGQALALVVAAPDTLLPESRRALGAVVGTLRQELTAQDVRRAARDLRRQLLFHTRTPERMAEVLGQFAERSGEARAAQRFYDRLEAVTLEEVRAAAARLAEQTPVFVQLPPQRRAP